MHSLNVIVLYYTLPFIVANEINILTDWTKTTFQCMNDFLENTRYLTKHDTTVTISGLDKKGERVVHSTVLRNINEMMNQYHQADYLSQKQAQEYYSELIHSLNSSENEFLVFSEKSTSNNLHFIQQNNKNIKFVWCENGKFNHEEQKPMALAIVNQVLETEDIDADQLSQPKDKASDKLWSEETAIGTKNSALELSPYSILTGVPGETVKLYFRVINTHWLPLQYTFHCTDQMGLIRSVLPTRILLHPNSAPFDIMVVLEVIGPEGSTDQITFSVLQPEFDSIKVNFYIGKLTGDTTQPTIDYTFNGDCRFANTPHTCASEKWSIEATIQDENSGLAMISSIPNNLRLRNEFSIGTREPVIVYYTATCCFPKFEIIATDLRGNTAKKTIDAEKQYLNIAEIGLIVLSGIILLVLIVLLICLVIRCQRRRKSQNFLSG